MKMFGFVILAALLALSSANCGCLKCSKHLRVVSPPCSPVQVIYRGFPDDSCAMGMPTPNPCPRPLPYQVQTPVVLPNPLGCSLKEYNYKIQPIRLVAPKPQEHCYREYEIKVQAPVTLPSLPPVLLKPLKARTDRIVIPAPEVLYCQNQVAQQQQQQQQILQQQQQQEQQVYVAPKPCQAAAPPTIEAYVPEKECYCHYRI